jgi:hypothetical protein
MDIKEMEAVAVEEVWKLKKIANQDLDKAAALNHYAGPHLMKGLKGVHFTVSYGGNLVAWYLQGAAGAEPELINTVELSEKYDPAGTPPTSTNRALYESLYDTASKTRKFLGHKVRYSVKSIDIRTLDKVRLNFRAERGRSNF